MQQQQEQLELQQHPQLSQLLPPPPDGPPPLPGGMTRHLHRHLDLPAPNVVIDPAEGEEDDEGIVLAGKEDAVAVDMPATKEEAAAAAADSISDEDEDEGRGRGSGHHVLGTSALWPWGMTNFHFSLCVGVVGFLIFWLVLLLRIYLPDKYWVDKGAGEEGEGVEESGAEAVVEDGVAS